MKTGAHYKGNGRCEFAVWAPFLNDVKLKIVSPEKRLVPMQRDDRGYWRTGVDNVFPGAQYVFRLNDDMERPDPASRFQPDGVHAPSQVIDPDGFVWEDREWKGIPLLDLIIYEIHAGTFTEEGTFGSVITRLDYLKDLGITAVELMPVAQFPGGRNWGYDGVYPYAVQNTYGGPDGLKALVNACHNKGLAVILDVVYNHLGPEGNYLGSFGPYFTDRYRSPWGEAVNFDGPYSDEVREYFIGSALYWTAEFHIDALRIDAIHGIFDFSARHFLQELAESVHAQAETLERKILVIAESDLNDVRVINPVEAGGYGLDAQWNDDFHHCVHTLLTGERKGYYRDFGKLEHLEKAIREGFVYSGQYSQFRKRSHGSSTKDRPPYQLIVFSQNHDQVGNRMQGDRLSQTLSFEKLKIAAGAVILSPNIPLLFMGEEYGEKAPFQYFVSHSDAWLIDAVRKGRGEEFASFQWNGEVPDPQAESTFLHSKLHTGLHQQGRHRILFEFYRNLIRLRKEMPALSMLIKENVEVKAFHKEMVLLVRRWYEKDSVFCFFNFNENMVTVNVILSEGRWKRILDSSAEEWGGAGASMEQDIVSNGSGTDIRLNPHSLALYLRIP